MSIQKELSDAASSYQQTFKELQDVSTQFTWARALIFVLLLVVLIGFDVLLYTALASLIFAGVFLFLLNRDHLNEKKKVLQENLWKINEEEKKRVCGEFEAAHTGEEYLDAGHSYAQDLDIFGKNSLIAMVNRAYLRSSRTRLAEILTNPQDQAAVQERQAAIAELKGNRVWRQSFQATLRGLTNEKVDENALPENLKAMPGGRGAGILAIVLGILTLTALVLVSLDLVPSILAWTMILINLLVILFFNLQLQKQALKTDHLQKFLVTFLSTLKWVAEGNFSTTSLRQLQSEIGESAIKEIRALRQIVFFLDSRGNLLWPLVNLVLVVDLHTFSMLQRWILKNEDQFGEWLRCINEFEALCSMASFAELNSDFSTPVFVTDTTTWEGKDIGHPLIPLNDRVSNDFALDRPVNLVTGSNMSGKSTFLRTIGLNTVMAWVGLPVCAQELRLSAFKVYTSMRTQDDLSSGTSSFYAELKRIRGLFDTEMASSTTVLYLLDEILKGTNSQDRHSGAKGIISRLLAKDAVGFISTHDLALADDYADHTGVKNYNFSSELAGDELVFDYRLHAGKCQNTNASILMKKLDIID